MDLAGHVAIVTGAGRGIGRAISIALAQAGSSVGLVARTGSELSEVEATLSAEGTPVHACVADVTDGVAVTTALRELEEALGPVDLLVNNAGRHVALGPLHEMDPEVWWGDLEVNLRGAFLCTHGVLAGMRARSRGRIVNVASHIGVVPMPGTTAYASAKAAMLRLTDALALELRGSGVSVFAISPGTVRTQLMDSVVASLHARDPEFAGIPAAAYQPIGAGADLVVALASGRADVLSGRYIHVLQDLDEMVRRADEIESKDLYTLRMRG